MKKMLTTLSLIAAFGMSSAQDNFSINTDKSSVAWHAEKVTGDHDGMVNIKSGSLEMTKGALSGGNFIIDMTSITCTDIDDPKTNGKLVGHLKSDDFFSVEKHPNATMKITKVSAEGKGMYKISANMTIKNITNEVTFMANVTESSDVFNAEAEITIDRTKYDVKYGSGSFFDNLGDKAIYDEFTLKVTLVTDKA